MHNLFKAFLQVFTFFILALFLYNAISTIRYPFGVDYGEAPLMDQARRVENGESLYKSDLNEPPYIIANYPPIYPIWVAALHILTNISLFQIGRITSVFFSLLCGYIISLFTYHLTENKWLGVFSAVLFIAHPYVMRWSTFARVDLMALAFSLLGLWILYRYRLSGTGLALACLCFLVSAYTKQTYLLSAPLAGFVWLWQQNRKRAVFFVTCLGISGLLIFGMINAITQGGFYMNIVVANANHYAFSQLIAMSRQLLNIWPVILPICVVMVILTIYNRTKQLANVPSQVLQQDFVYTGLIFYSLGAVIISATIGKVGSNVNYFLELIAAGTIWCGLAVKLILDQANKLKLVILVVLCFQAGFVLAYSFLLTQVTLGDLWGGLANHQRLSEIVKASVQSGTVLSDDYMDLIVLSGQDIYYQPFEYGELYYQGIWSPTNLVNQINQRDFPLILVGGSTLNKRCCWPPSVVGALQTSYETVPENDVLIMTPKK